MSQIIKQTKPIDIVKSVQVPIDPFNVIYKMSLKLKNDKTKNFLETNYSKYCNIFSYLDLILYNSIDSYILDITIYNYYNDKKKYHIEQIFNTDNVKIYKNDLFYIEFMQNNEGYTNNELYTILKSEFTEPTIANPSMNVLLTEINDNPKRKEAAPAFNPIVEASINNKTKDFVLNNFTGPDVEERLFNDLGDNFTFDQSMRAFNPTASTTIPNDQKAFTDYCYADMIACRDTEGNELACVRNAPPRWTNY